MTLSISWITILLFICIRIGTVLLLTPIQAIHNLPIHARLLFVFSLSILITQGLPSLTPTNELTLLIGSLCEFINGLILATSIYACFAIFQIAGQLIESSVGLNTLAIFNPSAHQQEALSSHLLSLLAVLFFFGMDGHLWLFKGLYYSFLLIPPGSIKIFSHWTPVLKQCGLMFSISFMIASPIVLALVAIDLCGGIVTRNMPQISPYFLTLPIKIILGFVLFGLILDYFNPIAQGAFISLFAAWQEVML